MKNIFFNFIFMILFVFPVSAYEIETHGFITYEAYKQSLLKTDASLLNDLGIKNSANVFGNTYYDMEATDSDTGNQTIWARSNQAYEDKIIDDEDKINQRPLSVEGWLMRGAIREDDCYILILCKNPFIDGDRSALTRPLNHFYDPVNDASLGILLGDKAPNRAFGTYDFTASLIKDKCERFDS